MWRNELAVEINASLDVVYRRLADFERHSDFSRGLAAVKKAWMPKLMRTEWEYVLTPTRTGTHVLQRTCWNGASLPGSLMLHLVRKRQAPRENQATLAAIKVALEKEVLVA